MKKLAIIGASYLQLPVFLKAKEMGIFTIGFAWEEGAVAKDICNKFYPISITEKETILEKCRLEQIDGVLTIASDLAVPTVNFVSEMMGLNGNSTQSAIISTNKFQMREVLKKTGLKCPEYFFLNPASNLISISEKIKYPAVVKPVDRSGSAGVSKVNCAEEFFKATEVALEKSLSKEAIVEDFIEGIEVSVETISQNGMHHNLAITDKETTGPPYFVEIAHHQPSQLPIELQKLIIEETGKGLTALGINQGGSHAEFIISNDGVFVTEIGARMGGDFIGSDLVFLSTGYDFLKGVIQVALGQFETPMKINENFSGVYFYSEKSQKVLEWIQQHPLNPIIVRAEIINEELIPLTQSSCRSGYFIYQSDKKLII